MKDSRMARIVRISVEPSDSGFFFATSPDLKGLLVGAETVAELEKKIPIAIEALYEAIGETVLVLKAEDTGHESIQGAWVKVPLETSSSVVPA